MVFFLVVIMCFYAPWVSAEFINSGTPTDGTPIPDGFDCGVRALAWKYGQYLFPERGGFRPLYDSLQLGNGCGIPAPPEDSGLWTPGRYEANAGDEQYYVDAYTGSDSNPGTISQPFQTIGHAVDAARRHSGGKTIFLRQGTFYLKETINLTPADNYLTIQNYPGEEATISGGTLLKPNWRPHSKVPNAYYTDVPAEVKEILGLRVNFERGIRARYPNANPETSMSAAALDGWITSPSVGWFPPKPYSPNTDVIVTAEDWPGVEWPMKLFNSTWTGEGDWGQYHYGYGGSCEGQIDPPVGYWCSSTAPRMITVHEAPSGIQVNKGVLPNSPYKNPEGGVVHSWRPSHWYTWMWEIGPQGHAEDPNWTYDGAGNNVYGKAQSEQSTEFIKFLGKFQTLEECQHAVNTSGMGPFHSYTWHHPNFAQPWATQCFGTTNLFWDPTPQPLVSSGRAPYNYDYYNFTKGGFQGGEGETTGAEWYIENIMEELDAPLEWYFEKSSSRLYFVNNASHAPYPQDEFVMTNLKVLFNLQGDQSNPVKNFTLKGCIVRDAAYTYMDAHGLPSGGDWALQKSGAITMVGTENTVIDGNHFTRNDGNAIFMGGYHRGAIINKNEFSWTGDSAIASWGDTSTALNANGTRTIKWNVGPDGRNGNQPRGTQITNNIAHELGIWEKQSSFYFQAVTAQTIVKHNVFFNGPRAGINYNDGFGGGDDLSENLLINTCRESGDHGPFNSWDRVPYITTIRSGKPSILPAYRNIHHNFFFGTYNSQWNVDNDDGSSFYNTHNNFLVYAWSGLKSDFGGNHNEWNNNIIAYAGGCLGGMPTGDRYYNQFINCTCAYRYTNGYVSDCKDTQGMIVKDNTIFSYTGQDTVCGMPFSSWQQQGHDTHSTLAKYPSNDEMLKWGWDILEPQQ